jgi:VanZ family protein
MTIDRTFVRTHLPALLWALLIFVGSSIPGKSIPQVAILTKDKLIHATIFFVLAYLIHRSFSGQAKIPTLRKYATLATIGVVAIYAASDELHQLLVPGRSCDIYDWMADVIGAASLLIGLFIRSFFQARSTEGSH